MIAQIQKCLKNLGRVYNRLLEVKKDRQVFLVGGAIRDIILNRPPVDFDFAVSGSGIKFALEFAQKIRAKFIILSETEDEARVVYRKRFIFDFNGLGDKGIESDLLRRDFTINAIAFPIPHSALNIPHSAIDPFGGQTDINRKLIRPVSEQSLALDPLRLLRAIRLALELGFTIHDSVYEQGKAITLKNIAAERLGMEFLRILEAPNSYPYLKKLHQLNRLGEIFPELVPLLEDDELCEHTFRTVFKIEELLNQPGFFARFEPEWQNYFSSIPYRRALLKLAGLLHDIAKPHTRFTNDSGDVHFYGHDSLGAKLTTIIGNTRLRLSRTQIKVVRTLVKEHMRLHLLATAPELTDRAIRRYFRDLGEEAFGLMLLCYADGWATAKRTTHLEKTLTRMIEQQRTEAAKAKIKRLITGDDLIALGMKPGPVFKVILQELEDQQIEGKFTTKEEGLNYLKEYLSRMGK
ncbi:MAG: HD domain-containing protein [candidate division WOR-3 bacterium]